MHGHSIYLHQYSDGTTKMHAEPPQQRISIYTCKSCRLNFLHMLINMVLLHKLKAAQSLENVHWLYDEILHTCLYFTDI